ncbi:MAG: 16S rRNA (cytidine(1402)-2'-O)-methyltransferase [Pseudomonadota bacterium]
MIFQRLTLSPGLYIVSTPIGNARDITLRALDVLASADVLAAEDTRTARRLMEIHGVPLNGRTVVAYHDHSGPGARRRLMDAIGNGSSVAYVSEAGTPLVADPGYKLVDAAIEEGHTVTAAPGASAPLAALAVSGLPTDRFTFLGFPPTSGAARRLWMEGVRDAGMTVSVFESPKRIQETLAELCEIVGDDRKACLCRELTKRFEEARRGTLRELADGLQQAPVKGECVLLIGPGEKRQATDQEVDLALSAALATQSVKSAAEEVAEALGLRRRDVYQRALALRAEKDS